MSGLRFVKEGPRDYQADGVAVHIDYCQNAIGQPWRVRDDRPPFPKPMDKCLSFHHTLADAKAWASAVIWPSE